MNLTSLIIPPWLKIAAPVAALITAVLVFRFVWLPAHDRAVRAEYLAEMKEQARKDSAAARGRADEASEARKEQTDEVQDRIGNSSGVDDLFERLRTGPTAGKAAPAP